MELYHLEYKGCGIVYLISNEARWASRLEDILKDHICIYCFHRELKSLCSWLTSIYMKEQGNQWLIPEFLHTRFLSMIPGLSHKSTSMWHTPLLTLNSPGLQFHCPPQWVYHQQQCVCVCVCVCVFVCVWVNKRDWFHDLVTFSVGKGVARHVAYHVLFLRRKTELVLFFYETL